MSARDDEGAGRGAGRPGQRLSGAASVSGARPASQVHEERFRVHLQVRFQTALDYVVEYAENLSRGGVFVSGAHNLAPRAPVSCEIELPGAGRFTVLAEVAHVLGADTAARLGRAPGAGLQITSSPPGFTAALEDYLHRLGRRRDVVVLTSDLLAGRFLSAAGFLVRPLPPPEQLVELMATSPEPVVGALVLPGRMAEYQRAAVDVPEVLITLPVDPGVGLPKLIDLLDRRLR